MQAREIKRKRRGGSSMRPRCTNNGGVLADRVHFFFSVSLSALDYIFRHMWCVRVCVRACLRVLRAHVVLERTAPAERQQAR